MAVTFSDVAVDYDARRITRAGQAVPVSNKAFDLLRILIDASPRVVTKEEIIDTVWPDVVVDESNIRNLIAELRRVLGDERRAIIRTAARIGYAFDATATSCGPYAGCLIDADHSYPLVAGLNVIGRDRRCSIVLDASGVSRQHARIIVSGNRTLVEDAGSKNGTWVNGTRIDLATVLRHGDLIALGKALLRFSFRVNPSTTTLTLCHDGHQ